MQHTARGIHQAFEYIFDMPGMTSRAAGAILMQVTRAGNQTLMGVRQGIYRGVAPVTCVTGGKPERMLGRKLLDLEGVAGNTQVGCLIAGADRSSSQNSQPDQSLANG
jgi:hypothetical protein